MVAIIRHYPEKDKGIVCPISNNGSHIDEAVWHLNIRGEMAEMSFNASAYNGEALTNKGEGNTVGSLTEYNIPLLLEVCSEMERRSFRYDPVTTEALSADDGSFISELKINLWLP